MPNRSHLLGRSALFASFWRARRSACFASSRQPAVAATPAITFVAPSNGFLDNPPILAGPTGVAAQPSTGPQGGSRHLRAQNMKSTSLIVTV